MFPLGLKARLSDVYRRGTEWILVILSKPYLTDQQGPCLLEWMPEINIDTEVPSQTVPHSRTYTNMTFDQPTGLMVAASSLLGPFILFDEDGNKVWEPEGWIQCIITQTRKSDSQSTQGLV